VNLAFVLIFCCLLTAGCRTKPDLKINLQPLSKPAIQANTNAVLPELKAFAELPTRPFQGEGWKGMFDGHDLRGWHETQFGGRGEVECTDGLLVLYTGDPFTGVNFTNAFPTNNYEIALDAMRLSGSDFFCGLTVPVSNSFCTLIVGGWGGSLMGISSLDGMDASENETARYTSFDSRKWYRVRLRVTTKRLEAWLDDDKVIDVNTRDRRIALRAGDIEMSAPVGIASWQTAAALRNIRYRLVEGPAGPEKKRL
jgi:hypothetical protein